MVKRRIRMKRILFYLCLASVLLLLGACETTQEPATTTEEAPNPFVGTWVLNISKSEFNPPDSAPQGGTVTIEAQENGLKFTFDDVDAEGNASHSEEAPKFDGEEYPVTGGDGSEDTVKIRKIDDHSFESVGMKDGNEVNRVLVIISDDGKTSTATITTKDENGQEVTSTYVYDKQ
jgi:hypothetical protein